jgi:uncharacterized protein YkwD
MLWREQIVAGDVPLNAAHGKETMHSTSQLRRPFFLAVITVMVGALVLAMAPAARAADGDSDPSSASTLTTLTNQDRAGAGLGSLAVASDLVAVAVQHSKDMAAKGSIYHNPDLASQGGSWQVIAENVGKGATPDAINSGFMQSPTHRANILNNQVTQIGIGIVTSGGTLWVTEIFRLPEDAGQAASAPAPAPAPQPAPAPAAEPEPEPEPAAPAPAPAPQPAPPAPAAPAATAPVTVPAAAVAAEPSIEAEDVVARTSAAAVAVPADAAAPVAAAGPTSDSIFRGHHPRQAAVLPSLTAWALILLFAVAVGIGGALRERAQMRVA